MVKKRQPDPKPGASRDRVRGWVEMWLRLPLKTVPDITTEDQIDLGDYFPSQMRLPLQEFRYELDVLQRWRPGDRRKETSEAIKERLTGIERPLQPFDLINLIFVEPSMKIKSYMVVTWPYESGALNCPGRVLVSVQDCPLSMLELFRVIPIKSKGSQ